MARSRGLLELGECGSGVEVAFVNMLLFFAVSRLAGSQRFISMSTLMLRLPLWQSYFSHAGPQEVPKSRCRVGA